MNFSQYNPKRDQFTKKNVNNKMESKREWEKRRNKDNSFKNKQKTER